MDKDVIRVGKISALYPEEGTARIIYEDEEDGEGKPAVSPPLPFLFYEIYPYQVDDLVWVAKLSGNTATGVILGIAFADDTPPAEGKEGLYRKDFSRTVGDAVIRYDPDSKEMKIICKGNIKIECSGNLTAEVGGTCKITASSGDVQINGISLVHHTHICPDGNTSAPK